MWTKPLSVATRSLWKGDGRTRHGTHDECLFYLSSNCQTIQNSRAFTPVELSDYSVGATTKKIKKGVDKTIILCYTIMGGREWRYGLVLTNRANCQNLLAIPPAAEHAQFSEYFESFFEHAQAARWKFLVKSEIHLTFLKICGIIYIENEKRKTPKFPFSSSFQKRKKFLFYRLTNSKKRRIL